MHLRFVALMCSALTLAGCLDPSSTVSDDPVIEPEPEQAMVIDWFADGPGGAPGNRMTFAANDGIIAVDDPDSRTIHIRWGTDLSNTTTYEAQTEPLNLAAALGPRGPVVAYRSQSYELYVAEWDGSNWNEGMHSFGVGSIVGFPNIAGTSHELLVGIPITPSPLEQGGYEVLHLTDGISADLSAAPSVRFPNYAIFSHGDVAIKGEEIAVSYRFDLTSVAFVAAPWSELASTEPTTYTLREPTDEPMGFYTQIAHQPNGEWVFSASAIPDTYPTGDPRDGFVFNLADETRVALQTRDLVETWTTPHGVVVVRTDENADYHVNNLTDGDLQEIGISECRNLAVLPDGRVATLDAPEDRWITELRDLEAGIPSCQRG